MKKQIKKRAVTLIEIMIVIVLISLIGGALAFNMRGSMDQGRAFKTEQNINRVNDILMMEYAKGELNLDEIVDRREEILNKSPLVKKGSSLLKDGWGGELTFHTSKKDDELTISSKKLEQYHAKHKLKAS